MCRASRVITAVTVAAWLLAASLVVIVHPGPEDPMRIPCLLVGVAAVVLTPYASFPWLVSSMLADQRATFEEELRDYHGAFLAGWEAAKEPEPGTPASVTPLRSVG